MKKSLKRYVSIILALSLLVTAMPASAMSPASADTMQVQESNETVQGVTPQAMADAISKFTDAMSKFAQDTSEMSNLSSFLTRFGGLSSLASGVIGILQMAGIIKDPTLTALGHILDEVYNIEDQLNQMDEKLKQIQAELVQIEASIEEKDRNNKADKMRHYWLDFNTDYCKPLDNMINMYQTKINAGIREWYESSSRDGLWVLYTDTNESPALTYTKENYSKGLPEKADNGETVNTNYSFGVTADYIPGKEDLEDYNPDKYRENFENKMAKNLAAAADSHKLEANDVFYTTWDALSKTQKEEKAKAYAADILNTQIYHISCQVMSTKENNEWVTDVANAYRNYCRNVLISDSGVNAMLNAMYYTHAFEGEIKKDIEDFCDSMIAEAGFYGQFAITCVCQDDNTGTAVREEMQKLFADTVNSLGDKKKHALTGYDNYCYITGTKLKCENIHIQTYTHVKAETDDFRGCTSDPWPETLPPILNSVYMKVLYNQYLTLNQGKPSFYEYLDSFKIILARASDHDYIMTGYGKPASFALNEGLSLKKDPLFGDYFNSKDVWSINMGNDSDIENQYFQVHDKFTFDGFDLKNETLQLNLLGGARALYGETHKGWFTDEICHFYYDPDRPFTDTYTTQSTDRASGITTYNIRVVTLLPVLKLEKIEKDKIENNPDSPFLAFGGFTLTRDIYNEAASAYTDSKTAISDMTFKKASYVYTGKAIKPEVTVKAGSKTLSASDYQVTYTQNKDVGTAMVTVTGKGNYAGMVCKTFSIRPKGTTISKVKRSKKTTAVTWKKQSSKMSDSRISGYQIRYSLKSSMKSAKTVNVKSYKTTRKKIKNLKKNKKYYFQIRTYLTSKKKTLYSDWSKKKILK